MRISLDGYGSKIRKVSRCGPTVLNEFFFAKVAPAQSITDNVLLGFWLILLARIFFSSYTTIYFFVKDFFFFASNVYISLNTKFECFYLSFDWETGHPLSMYAIREWRGSSKIYTGAYRGRGVSHPCLMVSCFICRNLTLPSFKKGVFVRNGYFSSMRSISVVMK